MIKNVLIITIICLTLVQPINQICTAYTNEPENSIIDKPINYLFSSNIDIDIDSFPLNNELKIDHTVNIPLTVKFETNIPRSLLVFIPWQIRNLIIFNQIIAPPQTVHLKIENQPDFAVVYLAQENVLVDWVSEGTTITQMTSLMITPIDAPKAGPFSFQIKAYCDDFGKISGDETIETITLNLPWESKLKIQQDDYILTTQAGSLVNTSITVTNLGNNDCLVIGKTSNELSNWSTCMAPSYQVISKNQSETFTFFIGIPKHCVNCFHTFQIEFTSVNIPQTNNTKLSDPVFISVFSLEP